ncbi:TPA: hypothetical protein L3699_004058 [Pseudomonas aeruginosa]|nr:hypothetical protein [Pseudomonas aeruginosa]
MSKELNKAPVEQAGGDERAAFEAYRDRRNALLESEGCKPGSKWHITNAHYPTWKASRAALAQPSGEVVVTKNESGAIVSVTRQDKEGRLLSVIAESQPSPAQAEQAEAERPEIVATLFTPNEKVHDDIGFKAFAVAGDCDKDGGEFYDPEKLMTVAQHGRIVGELRTEIAMLRSYESEWELLLNQHEQERDAALAEVECLRESKGDPSGSFDRCMKMMYERDENAKRLDAALARVAELTATRNRYGVDAHYFNKNLQRILRDFESFTPDELARSLIILAKVADEKVVAQAQHSVPEEFSFEYRHPNGECHTVTVSREQVINEMPDFLFEALCSKFCNCEPVGETNVVECCCDEYAEEFKLIAAAPGKEGL